MNHEKINAWITALRSGEYEQVFAEWGDDETYLPHEKCAVGVACDLEKQIAPYSFNYISIRLGISTEVLELIADFNDMQWSFNEIADLLEAYRACTIDYEELGNIMTHKEMMDLINDTKVKVKIGSPRSVLCAV